MPLADGDPAEVWDVWTRVITDAEYWKKDGTLHNTAFGGKRALGPPTSEMRPWSLELSGRLLSLIEELENECLAFCGERFAGVMFQTVENLRSDGSGIRTDVVYTPTDDNAHSDFVGFDATTKEAKFAIRDWLQDFIQHVRPDRLAAIEALRPPPAQ